MKQNRAPLSCPFSQYACCAVKSEELTYSYANMGFKVKDVFKEWLFTSANPTLQ